MESPSENPSKAAEYLNELNRIIETQQVLLEKQKVRIEELEQQVADLHGENAFLKDQYRRHMRTCTPDQNNHALAALAAIQENIFHTKSDYDGSRIVRRHASLPLEATGSPGSFTSPMCRRSIPCRPWKSFGSVDTLHQYCCPAPLYSKQLAVPAPVTECREDNGLHQFCCPPSGNSSPSR
ncbi:IQ motif and Sec7 domain ArfGEF 1a isoform X8 [Brachyhypopomus gauderio]|uniref:IQ motif and Sec7 domain ArfGEF 1a isoform X8 n=1 Tax=Brachyhypopomus gauderio TaxID=698409 RepID=UPI004041AF44